eukprot:7650003-Pyramimonas_sp.AAC.1
MFWDESVLREDLIHRPVALSDIPCYLKYAQPPREQALAEDVIREARRRAIDDVHIHYFTVVAMYVPAGCARTFSTVAWNAPTNCSGTSQEP